MSQVIRNCFGPGISRNQLGARIGSAYQRLGFDPGSSLAAAVYASWAESELGAVAREVRPTPSGAEVVYGAGHGQALADRDQMARAHLEDRLGYAGELEYAVVGQDLVVSFPASRRRAQGSRAISPYFRLRTHEAARLLDGLVSVDLGQLERSRLPRGQFPVIAGIQAGTVRYKRADPQEWWKTWEQVLGDRTGDCEDLSSAVAAEMRYNGMGARTYVYKSGPKLYHVVVATDRWGLLDPSRAAGMEGNG